MSRILRFATCAALLALLVIQHTDTGAQAAVFSPVLSSHTLLRRDGEDSDTPGSEAIINLGGGGGGSSSSNDDNSDNGSDDNGSSNTDNGADEKPPAGSEDSNDNSNDNSPTAPDSTTGPTPVITTRLPIINGGRTTTITTITTTFPGQQIVNQDGVGGAQVISTDGRVRQDASAGEQQSRASASEEEGMSAGSVVGIVLGCVLCVGLIAAVGLRKWNLRPVNHRRARMEAGPDFIEPQRSHMSDAAFIRDLRN
jgi:hypothetical protein